MFQKRIILHCKIFYEQDNTLQWRQVQFQGGGAKLIRSLDKQNVNIMIYF